MKNHSLFLLIAKLTPSEKRYLRRNILFHPKQRFMRSLFDDIDAGRHEQHYLKSKLHALGYKAPLHVLKHDLYHRLLKGLRHYWSSFSIESQIHSAIRNIDILFQKGLSHDAASMLKKAKKSARDYEKYPELITLLHWERKLHLFRGDSMGNSTVESEEDECLWQLHRLQTLWRYTRSKKIIEKDTPLPSVFHQIDHRDGLQARVLVRMAQYSHALVSSDTSTTHNLLIAIVEDIRCEPHRIKDSPGMFITALNNLAGYYISIKDSNSVKCVLKEIRDLPKTYDLSKRKYSLRHLLQTYNIELEYYRSMALFSDARMIQYDIQALMESHPTTFPHDYELMFYFQFGFCHLHAGHKAIAMHWFDRVIHHPNILDYSHIADASLYFIVWSTACMYDSSTLKSTIKSQARWRKKHGHSTSFSHAVDAFFTALSQLSIVAWEASLHSLCPRTHFDLKPNEQLFSLLCP